MVLALALASHRLADLLPCEPPLQDPQLDVRVMDLLRHQRLPARNSNLDPARSISRRRVRMH